MQVVLALLMVSSLLLEGSHAVVVAWWDTS